MYLKFAIKSVDMNGYLGRDHHPEPSDVGLVVIPVKMESHYFFPQGFEPVVSETGAVYVPALPHLVNRDLDPDGASGIETVWTCVTEDGRVLELMDHELAPITDRNEVQIVLNREPKERA